MIDDTWKALDEGNLPKLQHLLEGTDRFRMCDVCGIEIVEIKPEVGVPERRCMAPTMNRFDTPGYPEQLVGWCEPWRTDVRRLRAIAQRNRRQREEGK